jgi:FkbM family methyltransferase
MSIKHEFRKILWKMGYDISRLGPASSPLVRRRKLLESYAINVVLDVGANAGQFAMQMRNLGFSGKIVSFEPLGSAFELLRQNADKDPKSEVINCALGEINASKEINISANSCSSSLLDMLPAHTKVAPEKSYVAREVIEVRTLDSMINDLCARDDSIYLKIDTQGYEKQSHDRRREIARPHRNHSIGDVSRPPIRRRVTVWRNAWSS